MDDLGPTWRTNLSLLGLALAFAALEIAAGWLGPYGLFHDELYYWACAQRPGFGDELTTQADVL